MTLSCQASLGLVLSCRELPCPRPCPISGHRPHSVAGQCWVITKAVLLPEFRTTLEAITALDLPVGLTESFAAIAFQLSFSPWPSGMLILRILCNGPPTAGTPLRAHTRESICNAVFLGKPESFTSQLGLSYLKGFLFSVLFHPESSFIEIGTKPTLQLVEWILGARSRVVAEEWGRCWHWKCSEQDPGNWSGRDSTTLRGRASSSKNVN